ncbi:MAG: PAS domain S-box protein [Verrucomicrobiota bacterium]
MKPKKPTEKSTDATDLRRHAQARLQSQTPPPKVPVPTDEMQRLVQELQVHQIELEMQNETLEESHARLKASAARYTNLYDFAPVSYFTLGHQGEIIQSNLAGARMLGLERSRLLDRRFEIFVASADLPAFRTLLTRAFATQSPETIEVRLAIKDKPPLTVLLQASVSEDGWESRLVLMDITERKQAEIALRAIEEKHRLLFENAGDLIFINDEEGQTLDANPMAVKLLGYSRPELMSMTIQQIDSPEDRLHTADRIARLIQEGHLTFQTVMQRKDGSLIPIDVNARRIVWDGKPALLSICRDITERKQAERESQRLFAAMADTAPVLIWASGRDKWCNYFNKTWLDFTGRTMDQEMGNGWTEGVHPDDLVRYLEIYVGSFDEQKPFHIEYRLRRHDGEYRWVLDSGTPRYDMGGDFAGYIGSCTDITEHKRAEEALKRSARTNELLHNSIVALNACADLDSALACLAQKTIDLGDMDSSAVYLIAGQDAVLQHQIGLSSEFAEQVAHRPLNAPYMKAVLENPKEMLNLVTQFPEQAQVGVAHGLRHIYCIALCAEQQPFGFLTVASRSPEPPTAGNTELIRILALETQSLFHRIRVKERLRSVQTAMAEGIVFQATDGVIIDCNPSAEKILGLTRDQILGRKSVDPRWQTVREDGRVFPGEAHPSMVSLRTGQSCRDVIMGLRLPDGSQRWININAEPMFKSGETRPYAVLTSFADITKRREIERALQASLAEKTVLLREIHHRVKNNLQIIISLLNLQAGQSQKGDMLDILATTRNRVRSMALIHENLYRSENLAYLNLTNYLEDLCANLLRSAGPVRAGVRIESQVENKSISIGLNQAVPFGLLINEMVTNALKHAFPGERTGIIRVTIQSPTREKVLLTVTDDGVGLPAALDPHHTESLGLRLVYLLTDQLHGTVNFERGQGTTVQILFPNLAEAESL